MIVLFVTRRYLASHHITYITSQMYLKVAYALLGRSCWQELDDFYRYLQAHNTHEQAHDIHEEVHNTHIQLASYRLLDERGFIGTGLTECLHI